MLLTDSVIGEKHKIGAVVIEFFGNIQANKQTNFPLYNGTIKSDFFISDITGRIVFLPRKVFNQCTCINNILYFTFTCYH